ncbi:hypothetical protein [Companilactobacillus nodensis]|nr:hypothetical protein [Companilactobacillus nodensis]
MDPEFKSELKKLIQQSIEESKPRLWMNKKQTVAYLPMVNNTFDAKFRELPSHEVEGMTMYNKDEIDEFIKKH